MQILGPIFFLLAGACFAVSHTLSHHYNQSIFSRFDRQMWDPSVSWTNKYIDGIKSKGHVKWLNIWYRGRYWSIDYPDALTDWWHRFNSLAYNFFSLGAAISTPVTGYFLADYLIYGVSILIGFVPLYDKYLLIKK